MWLMVKERGLNVSWSRACDQGRVKREREDVDLFEV